MAQAMARALELPPPEHLSLDGARETGRLLGAALQLAAKQ
jgi:hypothetical protein